NPTCDTRRSSSASGRLTSATTARATTRRTNPGGSGDRCGQLRVAAAEVVAAAAAAGTGVSATICVSAGTVGTTGATADGTPCRLCSWTRPTSNADTTAGTTATHTATSRLPPAAARKTSPSSGPTKAPAVSSAR